MVKKLLMKYEHFMQNKSHVEKERNTDMSDLTHTHTHTHSFLCLNEHDVSAWVSVLPTLQVRNRLEKKVIFVSVLAFNTLTLWQSHCDSVSFFTMVSKHLYTTARDSGSICEFSYVLFYYPKLWTTLWFHHRTWPGISRGGSFGLEGEKWAESCGFLTRWETT